MVASIASGEAAQVEFTPSGAKIKVPRSPTLSPCSTMRSAHASQSGRSGKVIKSGYFPRVGHKPAIVSD
jgi:hypothetical protein